MTILEAEKIHPLADKNAKGGKIKFIHPDGKEHFFISVVNRMSGDRLTYFDGEPPSINDDMKYVQSVFRGIRKKAKVLEVIGDF